MIEALRRIVQEATAATDFPSALTIAATQIRDTLEVTACTIYLVDQKRRALVCGAGIGLTLVASGQVRRTDQPSLLEWIAERQDVLNLADAQQHPRYQNTLGTDEETCHAFLGVPLVQDHQTLGILVVRDTRIREFQTMEVDFLVSIAVPLAHLIHQATLDGVIHALLSGVRPLSGLPGAQGVAIGTITLPHRLADLDRVPNRSTSDPAAEEAALNTAISAVDEELRSANEQLLSLLPPSEQAMFSAHRLLLNSDSLRADINTRIHNGLWAPAAWRDAILARAQVLQQTNNPYLNARAEDIRDLGRRVLRHLDTGAIDSSRALPEHCVLLAEEMSVADFATIPPEQLAAIVCLRGSALSHIAILARAIGIPAVMNLGDRPINGLAGHEIIVDGYQGRVFIDPDPAVRAEYQRLIAAETELAAGLDKLRDLPAEMLDGYRVPLYVKAGLLSDIPSASNCGADGVGLYRTEFAFMIRESFPSEEEQYAIYQQVLKAFAPKPVTIRTLDIGGDKPLPYYPIDENNPFLGWRGLRFTLDHPKIFLVQLRAMLRANADSKNLRVLFPMITTVEELDEALRLLTQAYRELEAEGTPAARPQVGAMIEVPSAAWQAAQLARRVDFLSVGTNDLTQYVLAVDRDNAQVARLYDHLHPALLKTIAHILAGGHQAGRPVQLSGEMACDPGAALLLLGMGADSLNASPASLPRVKWVIRRFARAQARALAEEALTLETTDQIRRLLNGALQQAGLGEIVHESI